MMAQPSRILVVEDEADLAELVAYNLRRVGHDVQLAHDGLRALQAAQRERPDLVVLDLMLPRMDGGEVARRLRSDPATASIPILMLTAKATEADELAGLALGADDYIAKPFSMPVLIARVDAVLRRTAEPTDQDASRLGDVTIDSDRHRAVIGEEDLGLTATEFRLLRALVQANGRVLSRSELISKAIGSGVRVTDRTVDVHLASVRRKLRDTGALIETVRGVGYRAATERAKQA